MNKKQILLITLSTLITAWAVYFFYPNCDYQKNGWKKCDGKTITISGLNSSNGYSGGAMQHPVSFESPSFNETYLDTTQGQIVLLSREKINCPEKMTVIGKLNTEYGPCDPSAFGKISYCGSSITVKKVECN